MLKKKTKGFSIIEIVLVLGVIGILSTFIAPKVRNYIALSKNAKVVNILEGVRVANETFFLENGTYPTGTEAKDILVELKPFLDKEIVSSSPTAVVLEIGGSKPESNSTDVEYGGNIELVFKNGVFSLKPIGDSANEYNIRGELWSSL